MLKIRKSLGFTQIEIFIIVLLIGIMAVIAAPSLSSMLENIRMKQAAVELHRAFQEANRQSNLKGKICNATIFMPASLSQFVEVWGNCLSSGARTLPKDIRIATNVSPNKALDLNNDVSTRPRKPLPPIHRAQLGNPICYIQPSQCEGSDQSKDDLSSKDVEVSIFFGRLGASYNVKTQEKNSPYSSSLAKFIVFRPNKPQKEKYCVVVSRSTGLTRFGTYRGPLSPAAITSEGVCRVAPWTEQ